MFELRALPPLIPWPADETPVRTRKAAVVIIIIIIIISIISSSNSNIIIPRARSSRTVGLWIDPFRVVLRTFDVPESKLRKQPDQACRQQAAI